MFYYNFVWTRAVIYVLVYLCVPGQQCVNVLVYVCMCCSSNAYVLGSIHVHVLVCVPEQQCINT